MPSALWPETLPQLLPPGPRGQTCVIQSQLRCFPICHFSQFRSCQNLAHSGSAWGSRARLGLGAPHNTGLCGNAGPSEGRGLQRCVLRDPGLWAGPPPGEGLV